jgi:hypothetical protein
VTKVNRARHVLRTVGALLLSFAVAGAPALTYADHGFGGGGHFSGGSGHFSGGGGHFSGGHAMGGAHFGAPHFGGGGVPHFAGSPHFAAPHFGASAVGHSAAYGGTHFARPGVMAPHGGWNGGAPHSGWNGGGWHGGGSAGGWHEWHGGWWGGHWWPHVWFHPGFVWFLPVLPIGYATFWWGGMPYYYWNNLYYTWSPGDNGYVVTDPPPVANGADVAEDATDSGGGVEYATPPDQYSRGASPAGSAADVYLYPRNGQSTEQTQNDRYECHSWAVNQTGFDPTRAGQQSGSPAEYRRAMIACLDARGYSAR